ncbi:hypothetical protein ACP275_04G218900 [Erythranthe tilingii]
MSLSSTTTTTAAVSAADKGGGTSFTTIHPDVIQTHILNRLNGPTLASTSCASAELLSLCNDDHLWKDICNSTWPSTADPRVRDAISAFPSGHRSFYSDAFPSALRSRGQISDQTRPPPPPSETSELISAVDIFYDDELVYSKVMVTEADSAWFLNTPFRVDLLDHKETLTTPLKFDDDGTFISRARERLRVSWVIIDPVRKRAVNVASRQAVEARRHWLSEDIQLRYAIVSAAAGGGGDMVQCGVVVTCGGTEMGQVRVKEVSMQIEDMEGKGLTGMDSLVILEGAMDGPRSRNNSKVERETYEMFLRTKAFCRERKQRREKGLDMVCMTTGVSIFIAVILMFFLSR